MCIRDSPGGLALPEVHAGCLSQGQACLLYTSGIRPESIWVQLFDENNEAVGDVVKVPVSERNERDAFTVAFDDYRYDAEELLSLIHI